ncbi:hypothetical protein NQZ68_034792 [Dissostichus eleginoides]|nr:hypothetical protein NQZ68_034792 [Dissostichus eleginoides]
MGAKPSVANSTRVMPHRLENLGAATEKAGDVLTWSSVQRRGPLRMLGCWDSAAASRSFQLSSALCGVSLRIHPEDHTHSPGKMVHDVAVAVCSSAGVPGSPSFTVSLLSQQQQQQQQQQQMLRKTHALLASFVNPFYPAAQPADSLEVPSVCVDPQGAE